MLFTIILLLLTPNATGFIVGGCIGPKSVLEKYLTNEDRRELRRLVHTEFDGSNVDQILQKVNSFVYQKITLEQWRSILPYIKQYQEKKYECSVYAQLLPTDIYKTLMTSVWRATETGASKYEVKRLVEDYLERLIKAGKLEIKASAVSTKSPIKPATHIERSLPIPRAKEIPEYSKYQNNLAYLRGPPFALPRVPPKQNVPMFPLVDPFPCGQRLQYYSEHE
ncbi:unnamed protein product [Auanema sp. JU1783]|nr:unnamed protein product [Auanema sp. JU1783]